ncbi:MAG: phosphoglycerate dehydrogenase [Bacillota bacterium]|nr:phosphoglycerate dehydrogenase [Bacillota bacterium]
MNSYRVLITARSFGSVSPKPYEILAAEGCEVVSNPYDRPLKAGELATIIRDVDAVIVGRDVVDAAAIEAANRLKVICMHGVGLDAIDVEAARRKGIVVTNLPGGNSDSVAELAIGMMFCLARRILAADKCTREGGWGRFIGTELAGKTLGLVGLGHIGRAVAVRARALRMSVIAYDVERDDDFARMNSITYATLDEVLVQSDFVSLHVPLMESTRHIIDDEAISKMKSSAYLINTSRGGIVDEAALYEALKSGRLAGAALDVYEIEPPAPDTPLFTLDNCVCTPHIGARTVESVLRNNLEAVRKVLEVLKG